MPKPLITVVIPTVTGREALLAQCVNAYETCSTHPVEILVYRDRPTCGIVWQLGGEDATGQYIHLTADDLEPREGWDVAAVEAVDAGYLPAPRVLDPGGLPQYLPAWGVEHPDWSDVSMSTIPFLSRLMWDKIEPLFTGHYYTDNFVTDRAIDAGWRPKLRTGYAFIHHWGQPGRGAGMDAAQRMEVDRRSYERAGDMVRAGEWSEPWPHR